MIVVFFLVLLIVADNVIPKNDMSYLHNICKFKLPQTSELQCLKTLALLGYNSLLLLKIRIIIKSLQDYNEFSQKNIFSRNNSHILICTNFKKCSQVVQLSGAEQDQELQYLICCSLSNLLAIK